MLLEQEWKTTIIYFKPVLWLSIYYGSLKPFKKIRDTKGTFYAKMGLIKDRNGMNLTEAKVKKRWQEYTEELY